MEPTSDETLELLQQCQVTGYQAASVCVPVTVTPYAQAGVPQVRTCGDPVVTADDSLCTGELGGSCTFTIRQDICIAIPVTIDAKAIASELRVACYGVSGEDICSLCPSPSDNAPI